MRALTSFEWSVSAQCGLEGSNVFRISLTDDDKHVGFDTKPFNLTEKGATAPSTTVSSNSGLSKQAEVGVGVGVGLGCAFLIALGAILWYIRLWIKKATAAGSNVAPAHGSADNMSSYKQENIPQQPQQSALTELPGDRGVEVSAEPAPVRHELP